MCGRYNQVRCRLEVLSDMPAVDPSAFNNPIGCQAESLLEVGVADYPLRVVVSYPNDGWMTDADGPTLEGKLPVLFSATVPCRSSKCGYESCVGELGRYRAAPLSVALSKSLSER